MSKIKYISSLIILFLTSTGAFAQDYFLIDPVDPLEQEDMINEKIFTLPPLETKNTVLKLSSQATVDYFINAIDKFHQSNVKASYDDFEILINSVDSNDFAYINIAQKMAEFGFFNLANLAISKTKDKEIASNHLNDLKRFYFPNKKLAKEDEIYLAEVYSDIIYNDKSREVTSELVNAQPKLMSNYDYANYLAALGFYKSNNYKEARNYIDIALLQNPECLNYQKLKAEILAETQNIEEAKKLVEHLKKEQLTSVEIEKKVKSLEQYILYKSKKTNSEKDYHLGYYYFYENDFGKAIRTLQGAIGKDKKINGKIYALMGKIYLAMNEFEKAEDFSKKANKINSSNLINLICLGDLKYNNKEYKNALKYYKNASSESKNEFEAHIKSAKTYQKLSNNEKASKIYTKVLKNHSDAYEAYYNVALMEPSKEVIYLKKSVAINLTFKDGWLELARYEIEHGNPELAKKYLLNAKYIDENDFRYYYYQGLLDKSNGNFAEAEKNFEKCLKLNPDFENARKELSR